MHRIMFVCHGNICRSTMAEFVMKDLVKRAGREADFVISSSATSREEIGNDTHPGTKRALLAHDVPFSPRAAVQLRAADYDGFDLFVGMDSANIRNMRHMLGGDPLRKVLRLMTHPTWPILGTRAISKLPTMTCFAAARRCLHS